MTMAEGEDTTTVTPSMMVNHDEHEHDDHDHDDSGMQYISDEGRSLNGGNGRKHSRLESHDGGEEGESKEERDKKRRAFKACECHNCCCTDIEWMMTMSNRSLPYRHRFDTVPFGRRTLCEWSGVWAWSTMTTATTTAIESLQLWSPNHSTDMMIYDSVNGKPSVIWVSSILLCMI